ncbi:MAG: hypothetical protein EXR99_15240 [Gemmataceae bacterium]|nr:hypothetical protein [Gemmataceae bacterium]
MRLAAWITLCLAFTPALAADNWPHWRGPGWQGVSDDATAPLQWSNEKNLLWKTALPGGGNSSPIIQNGKVFLTCSSPDGAERRVVCVDAATGKVLWNQLASKGVAPGKSHQWNGYASASCATDGERVYAFFGTPGLFCYSVEGQLLWKKSFGIFTSEAGWGTSASPFLYEDLVIQNCDNDGDMALPAGATGSAPMSLVALDKKTGQERWSTPRNLGRGFSTPRLLTVAGGRVDLVLNGPNRLAGYDPKNGKELWRCDRSHPRDQARFGEPLPITNGRSIFILSGRPGPCQALRLPGEGDITKTHVAWEVERKAHRDVGSPVLLNDLIYQPDTKGMLTCMHLETGKVLYDSRIGNGQNKGLSSPLVLRGKILIPLDDGETVVVEPGAELKILYRNKLGDGTPLDFGASPAVSAGKIFFRSQHTLYCVGEK